MKPIKNLKKGDTVYELYVNENGLHINTWKLIKDRERSIPSGLDEPWYKLFAWGFAPFIYRTFADGAAGFDTTGRMVFADRDAMISYVRRLADDANEILTQDNSTLL